MPGRTSAIQSARCKDHAHFLKNLDDGAANAVFWGSFIFILIIAVVVSISFTQAQKEYDQIKKQSLLLSSEKTHPHHHQTLLHTRSARQCLLLTIFCFLLAAISVSIQAVALICLCYCHGEDLMFIYISVWTLLGIGSTIAMLGVAVNQALGFTRLDHPAYNVAMGTPVLVVSGIGHLVYMGVKRIWETRRERKGDGVGEEVVEPELPLVEVGAGGLSQGFVDLENGPVIQIRHSLPSNGELPPGAHVTQINGASGLSVVCYRQTSLARASGSIKRQRACSSESDSTYVSRGARSVKFNDEVNRHSWADNGSSTPASSNEEPSSASITPKSNNSSP